MLKFIKTIYYYKSNVTGKYNGVFIIEYDSNKKVVIEHEDKMYIMSHFVNEPIFNCLNEVTDKVKELIEKNIKLN